LAGCGGKSKDVAGQAAAAPPPAVVVTDVVQKTVPIYGEFVARTIANETVELRARVEGTLEKASFDEGAVIRQGQVMFEIEKPRYTADLQSAKAKLAKAESDLIVARGQVQLLRAQAELSRADANLSKANQDVARYKPLAAERAIPQQLLDTALAEEKVAKANVDANQATVKNTSLSTDAFIREAEAAVQSAKADVSQAELNLSYATVRSPITGIVGRRQVDVGNVVGRGEPTLLATVSDSDPIRVQFSISEADYLALAKRIAEGKQERGKAEFEMVLADNSVYPEKGHIRSVERAVDITTGTLPVEAEFPNPQMLIRPGQFGRIRVVVEQRANAVLVPQRSVQEVQGAKSVLVVGSDNKVALRTVVTAERVGDSFIVTEGVKPGEKIVVEGLQKARPGTVVAPTTQAVSAEQPAR
jgi:membrane fusion protein (multidrug efflux system)